MNRRKRPGSPADDLGRSIMGCTRARGWSVVSRRSFPLRSRAFSLALGLLTASGSSNGSPAWGISTRPFTRPPTIDSRSARNHASKAALAATIAAGTEGLSARIRCASPSARSTGQSSSASSTISTASWSRTYPKNRSIPPSRVRFPRPPEPTTRPTLSRGAPASGIRGSSARSADLSPSPSQITPRWNKTRASSS